MTDNGTKYITLIGTPLGQSFAARMQNRAYEAMGLNIRYFCTEADEAQLERVISVIKSSADFLGAAVTKPNKVSVMQYLDELDPLCEKTGACNTVLRLPDGRLKGFNTDGIGFYRSLTEDAGFSAAGKRFFCLGAGGAARAVCSVLAYYGAERIYITSKTPESRKKTAGDINRGFAPVAEAVCPEDRSMLSACDVIINATGVGMGASVGETPLPKEHMLPGKLYFDACYNPAKTRFLADAESVGGTVMNGLGMSLYQGAAQIGLWSGRKAPLGIMRSELMSILSETDRL